MLILLLLAQIATIRAQDSISCNEAVDGSIFKDEAHDYTFTLTLQQDVTFTTCGSEFDTTLRLIDSSDIDITDTSNSSCDTTGDDCTHDLYQCSQNQKETIAFIQLPADTYTLRISPYPNTPGGNYFIKAMCGLKGTISFNKVTGTVGDKPDSVLYMVNVDSVLSNILFTNCESKFDTQMNLYDADFKCISCDKCDGDDCEHDSYPCDKENRETFILPTLDVGKYFVKLNAYSSGGKYVIAMGSGDIDITTEKPSESPTKRPSKSPTEKVKQCGRHRIEWNLLKDEPKQQYFKAFHLLTENGIVQQFSRAHDASFGSVHWNPKFFPWHRWFLYAFESEIRKLDGYECFSLPYWDWTESTTRWNVITDVPDNNWIDDCPPESSIFSDYTTARLNWGNCLERNVNLTSGKFKDSATIMELIAANKPYEQFHDRYEGPVHAHPHVAIDGNMATRFSPDDPLFYLHHNFVDYAWALWQDCHDFDGVTHTSYSSSYSSNVNEWLEYKYDSISVIPSVQVKDTTDISTLNSEGYTFEKGSFWTNGKVSFDEKCIKPMNQVWFKTTVKPRSKRSKKSNYDDQKWTALTKEGYTGNERRHLWAIAVCEHNQETEGKVCKEPEYFEDCSDMNGDIDISLDELLSKNGLTQCMKQTRKDYYQWAKMSGSLKYLCDGCYDPFCKLSNKLQARCFGDIDETTTTPQPETTSSICIEPKAVGTGKAAIPAFYYDYQQEECIAFVYGGGSRGNSNRFGSKKQCENFAEIHCGYSAGTGESCNLRDISYQHKEYIRSNPNSCIDDTTFKGSETYCINGKIQDIPGGSCTNYWYGSLCRCEVETGSAVCTSDPKFSNAMQVQQCKSIDKPKIKPIKRKTTSFPTSDPTDFPTVDPTLRPIDLSNTCTEPKKVGPCRGRKPRYYYNYKKEECEMFSYGGCDGNNNNFMSKKECENFATANCGYSPGKPCDLGDMWYRHGEYVGSYVEKCIDDTKFEGDSSYCRNGQIVSEPIGSCTNEWSGSLCRCEKGILPARAVCTPQSAFASTEYVQCKKKLPVIESDKTCKGCSLNGRIVENGQDAIIPRKCLSDDFYEGVQEICVDGKVIKKPAYGSCKRESPMDAAVFICCQKHDSAKLGSAKCMWEKDCKALNGSIGLIDENNTFSKLQILTLIAAVCLLTIGVCFGIYYFCNKKGNTYENYTYKDVHVVDSEVEDV